MEERKFTLKEDRRLQKLVRDYGLNQWDKIAAKMKKFTPKECEMYYNAKMEKLKNKKPWTEEEDQTIQTLYDEYGAQWSMFVSFFKERSSCDIKNRYYRFVRKKSFEKLVHEDSSKKLESKLEKDDANQSESLKNGPFLFRVEDLLN